MWACGAISFPESHFKFLAVPPLCHHSQDPSLWRGELQPFPGMGFLLFASSAPLIATLQPFKASPTVAELPCCLSCGRSSSRQQGHWLPLLWPRVQQFFMGLCSSVKVVCFCWIPRGLKWWILTTFRFYSCSFCGKDLSTFSFLQSRKSHSSRSNLIH